MLRRHATSWAVLATLAVLALTAHLLARRADTAVQPADRPVGRADVTGARRAAGGVTTPPPLGAGRLVLRLDAAGPAMDVEVITLTGDQHRFLARRALEAGGELAVDVPGGTAVHVRAQAKDSLFALPQLIEQDVDADAGEVRTLWVTPRPPPRRPATTCPASDDASPPPGARTAGSLDADVDGDGDAEPVRLWSRDDGGRTTWWLGASGLGPGGARSALDVADAADPELLGAADADGRGADELLVAVGHGPSTRQVQVWALAGCALEPAHLAGEAAPATFAVGASSRDKSGVVCTHADATSVLTTWRAVADDTASTFTVTTADLTWVASLTLRSGPTTTWTRPASDDWTLLQAAGLRCGRPPYTLTDAAPGGSGPGAARPPGALDAPPAFTG